MHKKEFHFKEYQTNNTNEPQRIQRHSSSEQTQVGENTTKTRE